MPSLRHRGHPQPSPSPQEVHSESDEDYVSVGASDDGQEHELDQQVEQELLSDEERAGALSPGSEPSEPPLSPSHLSAALPPDLREISTLASWTVSSSKPGCSIPQLRHPSPSLFWQSDGPQPHYLNIHFFKLVRIVGLRLYLDFEQDESYTPTRIVLLAGSGMNDLVEWGEMRLESPRGWVWADFSGVGDPDDDEDDSEGEEGANEVDMPDANPTAETQWQASRDAPPTDDVSDFENTAPRAAPTATPIPANNGPIPLDTQAHHQTVTPIGLTSQTTPSLPRPHPRAPFATLSPSAPPPTRPSASLKKPKMPTLRCHLVQIKILENHQNGKDTHLRGLQIFARDSEKGRSVRETVVHEISAKEGTKGRREKREVKGLMGGGWMDEAVLR
ncbi:hypothetical protein SLS60_008044 [Paraconiothyrium brasiliense]|uniref:DOC domain-containing protein n=1 Tax=Paraconiothyrium brasiliense TaxID=300254 RepID=A0ABR3R397_9PLEO